MALTSLVCAGEDVAGNRRVARGGLQLHAGVQSVRNQRQQYRHFAADAAHEWRCWSATRCCCRLEARCRVVHAVWVCVLVRGLLAPCAIASHRDAGGKWIFKKEMCRIALATAAASSWLPTEYRQ